MYPVYCSDTYILIAPIATGWQDGTPLALDSDTLSAMNAAMITSLDSAPDSRLQQCAIAAGWDPKHLTFAPSMTHEGLEALARSLWALFADLQKFVTTSSDGARRRREVRASPQFSKK